MAQLNKAAEEKTQEVKAVPGKITGLVETVATAAKTTRPSENALKQARERDRELVKGVFKYHENRGGVLEFAIRLHKGDKIEKYRLVDGGIYTIPRGIAKHLNANTTYPEYENVRTTSANTFGEIAGLPNLRIKKKVYRTGFYPLDFVDVGDTEQQNNIVLAEAQAARL